MTLTNTVTDRPAREFKLLTDARLIEAGRRPFRAAADAQQHALKRWSRLYGEGLRFMSARLEANRSVAQELASCRSLPETLTAWSGYVDSTARQYSEEFERVAGLYTDQARELMDEVQHEAAEAVASVTAAQPAEAQA